MSSGARPDPDSERTPPSEGIELALATWPRAEHADRDIRLDKFSSLVHQLPIEDLRARRAIARGRLGGERPLALVVPVPDASRPGRREGLDKVFRDAGFDWREPGCSMCLAMNDDRLEPGERCASTSNRNFEGRQGAGGRTHLVSPAMAAAAAIAGHFVDVRRLT